MGEGVNETITPSPLHPLTPSPLHPLTPAPLHSFVMVTTITPTKPKTGPKGMGRGRGGDLGSGKDRAYAGGSERSLPPGTYHLGVWIGLASITMLFIAFTSAYIVRQGVGGDWQVIRMPRILWLTSALLLVSSFTLELARLSLKRGLALAFNRWLTVTTLLGVLFLLGQLLAWRQLATQGIYVNTNPHSAFFYLLSGAHGLHLLGGVIALSYVVLGARRHRYETGEQTAVNLTAIYWHFMDVLWVYLFILLFIWK